MDSSLPKEIFEEKQQEILTKKDELDKELDNLNNGISEFVLIRDELINLRKEINNQILKSKNINKEKFINIIESIRINNDEINIITSLEVLIEEIIILISE
ncbi:hypothetical protein A500_04431 [Clostridium sartagoforme AAU1]|uniref:Uncharacterized protein n=1 Tax=Clostridium sartagoforme AAU1 TaxID=1202534 RepID=R9CK08_9CLOT|nr:hypothetical protein [Clostridium sartagoforme]EOR27506.1 hypothetical protein A500_04431 [Clostridium sartagoforme AAU1]